MAKIQLNGRKLELKTKHSILTLLKKYNIDDKKIAPEGAAVVRKLRLLPARLRRLLKVEATYVLS